MQRTKICASLCSRMLKKSSYTTSTDAKYTLSTTVRGKGALGIILKSFFFFFKFNLHNRSDNLQDLPSLRSVIKQETEITECDL